MKKCPVLLTFDVDGETLWISRNPDFAQKPVIMSQGRYGVVTGLPRILQLLKKYGIPATFFVPGWIIENHQANIAEIIENNHEIGHHGYLHEWPDTLSYDEEKSILEKGIEIIERLTGDKPRGYRSPAWEFSPNTLNFLQEYGFLYSSNFMDRDDVYVHEGTGLVEIPVQWHLDDAPFFLFNSRLPGGRAIQPIEPVLEIWKSQFDFAYETGTPFVLTCHPQLMGHPYRIKKLESLIAYIRQHESVEFMTCEQLARSVAKNG